MKANRYARQFARASGPTFQRSDFERAAIAEAPMQAPPWGELTAPSGLGPARRAMTIGVDTREQRPWAFPPTWNGYSIAARPETLATGDYALLPGVLGGAPLAIIERKNSLDEMASCLTHDRPRFMREIDRLLDAPCRAIIVESAGPMRSMMSEQSFRGSVQAIEERGVVVRVFESRAAAIEHALHLFRRALNHYEAQLRAENRGTK